MNTDKNSTQPTPGNGNPFSAGPSKPLFVTEEEPAAPPPPIVPPADKPQPPFPVSPPPSSPPTGGDGSQKKNSDSILPPIIEVPKKKSRAKLVAGLAAVLLLVVSIPLAVFVIGQNTELREKARSVDDEGCEEDAVARVITKSDGCKYNIHQRKDCSTYEGGAYDCPSSQPAATATPAPQATPVPGGGGGTGGDGGTAGCPGIGNAGPLVHTSEGDNVDLGNQQYASCDVVASFVAQYGTFAGRAWAVQHTCQPNVAAACDGQNLITQGAYIVQQYISANGVNACQVWANAHNSDPGTNCQGAGTANQCTGVRIYKYPYNVNNEVSAPFNGKLAPGDAIKVCLVTSGSGGRPEVAFDGTQNWEFAGETGPRGEACRQHDIPAGATTLRFGARY